MKAEMSGKICSFKLIKKLIILRVSTSYEEQAQSGNLSLNLRSHPSPMKDLTDQGLNQETTQKPTTSFEHVV